MENFAIWTVTGAEVTVGVRSNVYVQGATRTTFPAVAPKHQIDYVLYQHWGTGLISTKAVVVEERLASDHCPLLVEFTISDSDN